MIKILTIVGARPQFIKASVVSRAIASIETLSEVVVHTGQHFDTNMSDVFFGELDLKQPSHQLGINSGSHGEMTGRMLAAIEKVIVSEKPDYLMVYGDTNSTLAGALAAAKLHVPIAHVEAGLRSFNMRMPEEINRVLTDQISNILFCPTETSIRNLSAEGFDDKDVKVLKVGDVMQDAALFFADFARPPDTCGELGEFALATVHRAENTDDPARLAAIAQALNRIHEDVAPVVLPLHPRTRAALEKHGIKLNVHLLQPVGYFEMIWLLKRCGLVMTDSGGVQKEGFIFGKPCITMRDETEWLELVEAGANQLVGASTEEIIRVAHARFGEAIDDDVELYGGGRAAGRIAECLNAHAS